jgi:hypothetical protein
MAGSKPVASAGALRPEEEHAAATRLQATVRGRRARLQQKRDAGGVRARVSVCSCSR